MNFEPRPRHRGGRTPRFRNPRRSTARRNWVQHWWRIHNRRVRGSCRGSLVMWWRHQDQGTFRRTHSLENTQWLAGEPDLGSKWVKLPLNRTHPWLFQIRFPYITLIWFEKVPDVFNSGPIWPTLGLNLVTMMFFFRSFYCSFQVIIHWISYLFNV